MIHNFIKKLHFTNDSAAKNLNNLASRYCCKSHNVSTTVSIIQIAMCGCLLSVLQVTLSALPNVELISLTIAQLTLIWPKQTKYSCIIYVFLCGIQSGFGLWLLPYLFAWLFFRGTIALYNKHKSYYSNLTLSVLSGMFGLIYGVFFALPYLLLQPEYALSYWIAGLPWDVVHGIFNFIIMFLLGKPIYQLLTHIKNKYG